MKSLDIYRGQMDLLRKKQREVVEDMAQVLAEAKLDGYSVPDVLDGPQPTPDQPSFDL
jgi:hypothetical protein